MKRQFSDQIRIKPLDKTEFKLYATTSDVILDDTIGESSHGVFYKQTASAIIDRNNCAELIRRAPSFAAIIELDDATDTYIWGDSDNPVKCTILPKLEKCLIEMTRNSLTPIIK